MRQFQTILLFLFGLLSVAFAEEAYDTTIYLTNTVTQVYTVTRSGPSSDVVNSTSTIYPTSAYGTKAPYPSANVTSSATGGPSATGSAAAPPFTGAASQMNVNAIVAVLAMGMGLLAL